MKTLADARALATALVELGKGVGVATTAFLTDMDQPLGLAIGNANETAGKAALVLVAEEDFGSDPEHVRILQAIEQGFADTPVVNTARVAELKQAISNGHFKVDAEKVADRLLTTVRDLILAHKA